MKNGRNSVSGLWQNLVPLIKNRGGKRGVLDSPTYLDNVAFLGQRFFNS